MKLFDYMHEIKGVLLVCFSGGLFFTLVLAAFGVSAAQLILLWMCFCLILFSTLLCCWQKKRRRRPKAA